MSCAPGWCLARSQLSVRFCPKNSQIPVDCWEVQQTCCAHSLVLFGFHCTKNFTLKGQATSSGSLFQITPVLRGLSDNHLAINPSLLHVFPFLELCFLWRKIVSTWQAELRLNSNSILYSTNMKFVPSMLQVHEKILRRIRHTPCPHRWAQAYRWEKQTCR